MSESNDQRYTLDTGRSTFGFKAKAFLMAWVSGTFSPDEGEITQRGSAVHAKGSAPTATVSTGLGVRDWHLRHKHYLHAAEHPQVQLIVDFELDTNRVTGEVRARGRRAPVDLTIESFDKTGEDVHVRATGSFDRRPLGMLPPLAGVNRIVQLDLDVRGTRVVA